MTSYATYTDDELVRLLRGNDRGAFTEIYNRYWDKLLSVAANKLGEVSLAEELVQDLFLDLWQRRQILELNSQLGGYLAVAMKYKIIDARRKRTMARAHLEKVRSGLSLADNTTERQLQLEDLQEQLARLVRSLPEKCRLIYRLSKEEGLSQQAIAQHLGLAPKTVESHLARAYRSLRAGLSRFFSLLAWTDLHRMPL